jgi:hypothetical protein
MRRPAEAGFSDNDSDADELTPIAVCPPAVQGPLHLGLRGAADALDARSAWVCSFVQVGGAGSSSRASRLGREFIVDSLDRRPNVHFSQSQATGTKQLDVASRAGPKALLFAALGAAHERLTGAANLPATYRNCR